MTRNGGWQQILNFHLPSCCSVDLGNAPVLDPTTCVQYLAIAAEPYLDGFTVQVLARSEVETRPHSVTGDRLQVGVT